MAIYKYDRYIEKMQSEIDVRDEEIKRLKSVIESLDPEAETETTFLKRKIRILEETIEEKGKEIKRSKAETEKARSETYDTKKELCRATNQAEMYRTELMRLKFTIKDEPMTVYRNAPSTEMLERSGINVIYVEKQKSAKSKEQNEFDRQYKKVRLKILERDGYKCVKCGKDEELHVHHKVHRESGGTNDFDNLETLCKWCHAEKHKGENVYNIMAKSL
jgi:5-methylcytosine-specific restriction endonuclease McrA